MKYVFRWLAMMGWLWLSTNPALATNYFWLTDRELSFDGELPYYGIWNIGDTVSGTIHSNSQIPILHDPTFYNCISSSAADFWHGPGYNPHYIGGCYPRFNAPRKNFPTIDYNLRDGAAAQGHFYAGNGNQYMVRFDDSIAKVYRWPIGTVIDSTDNWMISFSGGRTCIFIDAPVRVHGFVGARVTLGSSQVIEIEGDLRYTHANPYNGILEPGVADGEILGLVSEGDIVIRNTVANGRENSNGLGSNQTNRNYTSVVITAALRALGGSLTFEDQNDPDSGYVCDCSPDYRGTIYLYGSITERQRGRLFRQNNGGTGYALNFRYDSRLYRIRPPCFYDYDPEPLPSTDSLDFGEVIVGTTVWDTAHIYLPFGAYLGSVYTSYPFYAVRQMPFQGQEFIIPTRFTPPRVGLYSGILYVSLGSEFVSIVLRGRGVAAGEPLQASLDVSPNPFNLSTTFRYYLPEAGDISLALFDVLGREAKAITLPGQAAGEHSYTLNAADLASGVYFVHMQTPTQSISRKLLLVK